jgi:hypothetical protein
MFDNLGVSDGEPIALASGEGSVIVQTQEKEAPKREAGLASNKKLRMLFPTFAQWLHSVPKEHRKAANNPTTRKIFLGKRKLLREIKKSAQLARDFGFFLEKTGWDTDQLLQYLFWDCNMMHADPQTVIRKEKARTWPIDRETLNEMRTSIRVLTEQIERVSKTDFSPARTVILHDEKGGRLRRPDERYLLMAFSNLPGILRFYGRELSRKVTLWDLQWPRAVKRWEYIVTHARKTSLYEQIRAKTGQYHAVRLHRLVSISREVQGLPPIEQRAFVMWLNRLKKRHQGTLDLPASSSAPDGSPRSPQA